jgi:A/G-specific adenine glycosylase
MTAMPPRPAPPLPASAAAFQAALLAWYEAKARPLPWRTAPSAYKTVVSEFMLQQTQVKTVLPYFDRWLREFPDFAALAAAPTERVLKRWEGLGYYSRARNLHRLAQAVGHCDPLPRTVAAWRELPGVGPYTAAAVTSIAFGFPAACVDGNVVRILARLTGDRTMFRDSAAAAKAFTPLANAVLSRERPGDHNQAMMELGATVCLRPRPQCPVCPVRRHCVAARRGDPSAYPQLQPKTIEQQTVTRGWCLQNGALLLHRAAGTARRLAGQHELPTAEQLGLAADAIDRVTPLAERRRSITRFRITERIYRLPAPRGRLAEGLVWVPLTELPTVTLSGPHRRWTAEILGGDKSGL